MTFCRLQRGAIKAPWLVWLAIIGAIAATAMVFLAPASPSANANAFMDALARRDAKKLSQLSFIEGVSQADLEKKWDTTVNGDSRHYRWSWRPQMATTASSDVAAVSYQVTRDWENPGAYEEKFELPMVKKDGQWKVDVRRIDRRMFPFLPR